MKPFICQYSNNYLQLIKKNPSRAFSNLGRGLRCYPQWKKSLMKGVDFVNDRLPWITFHGREFIESLLTLDSLVFEYGSGGSTLYYSARCKYVISVEHDSQWFNAVNAILSRDGISNCHSVLIAPQRDGYSTSDPADPRGYYSSSDLHQGWNFKRYVAFIDSFPDCHFDFVAIDGRARPSCILHARRKIKVGGYLMLDNSDRPQYEKAKDLMLGWAKYEFFGPGPYNLYFWETTVWKKMHA
jgi:hypothetical protein